MATCHRHNPTNLAAVVLDNHRSSTSLCSSFSRSSFRRKLIHSLRCGGGCSDKPKHKPLPDDDDDSRSDSAKKNGPGSEKLSELLRLSEDEEDDVKKKTAALDELKNVVKGLQCDDVLWGAKQVRRLTKEDPVARTTLALLGAIPTLVGMLDSRGNDLDFQISALYALLNLGIANPENKAAIVKAGAVHKMLNLIESSDQLLDRSVAEAIVANFLGLSALDVNKPIIGSSGAIPFLVKMLKDGDSSGGSQAKQDTLRALYNLSISPSNISPLLETEVVQFFVSSLGDMEVSERILLILSNVVSTLEGRKAVSSIPNVFPILIDALSWNDSPGCQEIASYILMVMAHKSYVDRQAMIEAGVVSALLELTLIGSNLAQKRASRLLECLRVDKGKQVSENCVGGSGGTLSAPLCGASPSFADPHLQECPDEDDMMSEEKKAVKHLVQQSLQNNMRRIVKRANLPQDFVPSDHLKSLIIFSHHLPFHLLSRISANSWQINMIMEALVGSGAINPFYANCRRFQNHLYFPKLVSVKYSATSKSRFLNLVVSASFESAQPSTMDRFDNTLPSKEVLEIWRSADAVCFDVDSTVCLDEGIDELAEFCGAGKAVAEWTARAMNGSVPFEEALAARLSLFNPSLRQVQDFLETRPPKISPGIAELVSKLRNNDTNVYLISGGFRQMINPVASILGIPQENIFANQLLFGSAGEFLGFDKDEPTSRSGGKATAVQQLKKAHNYKALVMIGDGATDLEARQPGGADLYICYAGVQLREAVAAEANWLVFNFRDLIDSLE